MVEVKVDEGRLILEMEGLDKLWTLRSRIEIPLKHVRGARFDPSVAQQATKAFLEVGLHLPGLIMAGTVYQEGRRVFCDVKDASKTVVIDLLDERYDELIVEVADPMAVVEQIRSALG
jgi:hypothetical protein